MGNTMSNYDPQLGSQTLCKLLDADHDDPSNDIFDNGQNTEISICAHGDFGEMKKTESWQSRSPATGVRSGVQQESQWKPPCLLKSQGQKYP